MNDFITSLLASANTHTEIRSQLSRARRVSLVGGRPVGNVSSQASGVSARVYQNGVWGFASSNEITPETIKRIQSSALENACLLSARKPKNKPALANVKAFCYEEPKPFHDISQKTLMDFAGELDSYIEKNCKNAISRTVSVTTNCIEKNTFTSFGSHILQRFPRAYIIVAMSAQAKDGETVELFDVLGGGGGYFDEYYQDPSAFYEQIDRLYTELMKKREGIYPEAGECTCIIDSAIAGMVAHEAVGHTVEADLVLAGSVAADSLNKQVASSLINLTDFAHTAFGKPVPLPVYADDEGLECKDAVIIKDGILVGYMNNSESALHYGMAPCGNARAYSYSDEPLIRMRNTAIHPGKSKLEDMIASIEKGYYLTRTQNGQADTTGEFMFGITFGYEIINGKLGRALRDTTISGVAFDMLKTVDMISDTVAWDFAGYCGKKQPMPVSMGGPCLRCRVNIGGR